MFKVIFSYFLALYIVSFLLHFSQMCLRCKNKLPQKAISRSKLLESETDNMRFAYK